MRTGYSLLELILALTVFQIGLLGTVGMVSLAQRNLQRAEITLRGLLEAGWIADSLSNLGVMTSGRQETEWGELVWAPVSAPVQALRVSARSPLAGDTVATVLAFPPIFPPSPVLPDSVALEGRW